MGKPKPNNQVTKIRPKPADMEAMRVDGTRLNVVAIATWMQANDFDSYEIVDGEKGYGLHLWDEGSTTTRPGDWIVRTTHGGFFAVTDEYFQKNYAVVEP